MSIEPNSWPTNMQLPKWDPNGTMSREDFEIKYAKIKRRRENYELLKSQLNDRIKSKEKDMIGRSGIPSCDNARENRNEEDKEVVEKLYTKSLSLNETGNCNYLYHGDKKVKNASELNETGSIASPTIVIDLANKKSDKILSRTLILAIVLFGLFYYKRIYT